MCAQIDEWYRDLENQQEDIEKVIDAKAKAGQRFLFLVEENNASCSLDHCVKKDNTSNTRSIHFNEMHNMIRRA